MDWEIGSEESDDRVGGWDSGITDEEEGTTVGGDIFGDGWGE